MEEQISNKKILITGSSGFIGRHLKKLLPFAVGLDTTPSETTDIVEDIREFSVQTEKYDVVYHLAAFVGTESSIKHPIETYSINVCGTLNLLRSFRGLFIFTSTVGVFEPLKTPYFLSKYVCEQIIKASSCKYLIFRLPNPYGWGSKSVIQKWLESDKIEIYGDGSQTRDFVYIDDVIKILANPFRFELNNTYNIGTGSPITLSELAQKIITLCGKKKIEYLPARDFEIKEPIIKPDIICKTTIDEGLKKMLKTKPN